MIRILLLALLLLLSACRNADQNASVDDLDLEVDVQLAENPANAVLEPGMELLDSDEVRRGDHLPRMLARLGVVDSLQPNLERRFAQLHDVRRLVIGHRFELRRDTSGVEHFCYYLDPVRRVRIPLVTGAGAIDSLCADTLVVELAGTIDESLYLSMMDAGASPALVAAFNDILQWDIDFGLDVRSGDTYWLRCERLCYRGRWLQDSLVREGRIWAAEYQGQRGTVRAAWSPDTNPPGYYDAAGQSFQKQFLRSPLNYRRVSSSFGMRTHPISKQRKMHTGVDLAAPKGTPVVSAADGVVELCGWQRGTGKTIRIKHGSRYLTVYGHLDGYARGMKKGTRVSQNQVIGYVGTTGNVTGPHLHYEFHEHGRLVDPMKIRNNPVHPVPAEQLPAFQQAFQELFQAHWLSQMDES